MASLRRIQMHRLLSVLSAALVLLSWVDGAPSIEKEVDGSTYTRWGSTSCPRGSNLIYRGHVGGSLYGHVGGAVDYICLPRSPEWGDYNDAASSTMGYMYGAEYRTSQFPFSDISYRYWTTSMSDHDVPCAVCHAPRPTVLMIPARKSCYPGWTLEYNGYLVADYYKHQRTEHVCMDEAPEVDVYGHASEGAAWFYPVEGHCGSLPCPPYSSGRELTCAVCTM